MNVSVPPPEESLEAIVELAQRVLEAKSRSYVQDANALARIALDFVTMKREYAIMLENVTDVQRLSTQQEQENRSLRSVLARRLTKNGELVESGLLHMLRLLLKIRYASDGKHGDARAQVALPDGIEVGEPSDLVEQFNREDLDRRRAAGTVTWLSILRCERAEVDNARTRDQLVHELLDEANVCLKWLEALALRTETKE
jgi:hypothetical protein